MKNRFLLLVVTTLFTALLFTNCNKNKEEQNPLAGKWSVVQIMGGMTATKNYEEGSFTWDFNFDTDTVTIVNSADIFDALYTPTFENNRGGTYAFTIKKENNIDYLVVGDRKGHIKFTDTGVTIDYGIAFDDVAYVFKR